MSGKVWAIAVVVLFLTGIFLSGGIANAATSITVKADNLIVNPGSTFDFNIYVDSLNPNSDKITSGDFDIYFSQPFDFTLNSITPGPGLFFLFGNPTSGSNYVDHIEPVTFTGVGSQVFATLNFTAPNFITNSVVDLRDGGNGWGIFGSPEAANVTYVDGSLAVAPEPISSVLFLLGGATLGIRRFCKKK